MKTSGHTGTCDRIAGTPVMPAIFAEVSGKVNALNLSTLKRRLMDPINGLGWTQQRADAVEREYRNFLILCAIDSDKSVVPTKDIDEMWHAHILDTQKYAVDCQYAFGAFMHHRPGTDGDTERLKQDGADTQQRYEALFGAAMGEYAATCDRVATCDRLATCDNPRGNMATCDNPRLPIHIA